MSDGNRNLAVVVRGDDLGKGADHVDRIQPGDDIMLEFLRHEVAAVLVGAFGQHVVDGHLAAQMPAKILLVSVGGAAGFLRHRRLLRLSGDGLVHRLGKLRLIGVAALHAADLVGQVVEVLLHAGVNGIVLGGQDALVVAVGIQEALHGVPESGALCTQFVDSHSDDPPQITYIF